MDVGFTVKLWLEGRSHLLLQESIPVGPVKPSMTSYFCPATSSQPSLRVFVQEPLEQVLQEGISDKIQRRFCLADFVLDGLEFLMLDKKRREACNHLEYQVPEGPPVQHRANITPFFEEFRWQIFRGTCNRIGFIQVVYLTA